MISFDYSYLGSAKIINNKRKTCKVETNSTSEPIFKIIKSKQVSINQKSHSGIIPSDFFFQPFWKTKC